MDSFEFKGKSVDVLKMSKTSFTVRYQDGETHDVKEGILFEVDPADGHIIFHNGTDRASVLFFSVIAMYEAIERFGLAEHFERFLGKMRKNAENDVMNQGVNGRPS